MEIVATTRKEYAVPVTPYVTYALIVINVVVFLVGGRVGNQWGGVSGGTVFGEGDYYRLLTAMFLHANALHIASNMFALFYFGKVLEAYINHIPFLLLYVLGGLIASHTSAVYNAPNTLSVGASGAVFAVLGGGLWYFWRLRDTLDVARDALGRCARALLVNLTNLFNSNTDLDNWAHLGGLVGGMVIAALLDIFLIIQVKPEMSYSAVLLLKYPRVFRFLCGATAVLVVVLGVSAFTSMTPQTLTLENFSVSVAPGWRSFSDFQTDEFCQKPNITCLALLAAPSGMVYEIDRFSGASLVSMSLEQFVGTADRQLFASGRRLQSRQRISIDGRDALQRVYSAGTATNVYIFLKDDISILRIYAVGDQISFSAVEGELETFLQGVKFSTA
jgi:rhomboid protease GluP